MSIIFFDIETNGLLPDLTKGHCMVTKERTKDGYGLKCKEYRKNEGVRKGAARLLDALRDGDTIVGHNIISFDIPALKKLYPDLFEGFELRYVRHLIYDTLVMSYLMFPDLDILDIKPVNRGSLPGNLRGSHKLEAWGYRLGKLKGTYGEQENAWESFSEEMLEYNTQDVVVTEALYDFLETNKRRALYPSKVVELEHNMEWLLAKMHRNGFPFDVKEAELFCLELEKELAKLSQVLFNIAPPIPDKVFVPKRDNKTLGYVKGVPIQRFKEFNPNSRDMLKYILVEHYKYQPDNEECYKDDKLSMSGETFEFIMSDPKASEEIKLFAKTMKEYFDATKMYGMLSKGKNAWLKLYNKKTGCIHGRIKSNGAATARAAHTSPNIAQVPSVRSAYSGASRRLFKPQEGWLQVGVDASGLELRCLAHYMYPYDNGEYAHEILNGDIHTRNQLAAELETRDNAKTFIYGFLYGAGNGKIGQIVHGTAADGARLRKRFLTAIPAIKVLKDNLEDALVARKGFRGGVAEWKRKYIKALDGRPIYIKSLHSALNYLLQSCGAIVCKYWIVQTEERLLAQGLHHGKDFKYMTWVHDEIQLSARTQEIAEVILREAQEAMRDTQEFYKFKVQLDTDGKIGNNWEECH